MGRDVQSEKMVEIDFKEGRRCEPATSLDWGGWSRTAGNAGLGREGDAGQYR